MTGVTAAVAPSPALVADDKRAQSEALLTELFRLMDYPARLEFKDLEDGSLGVAVHVEGEPPGITPGKKSYLLDSIQFLINKAVNRPNLPRRWVNLALNAFPEPRLPKPTPSAPRAEAPAPATPAKREDKREDRRDEKREEREGSKRDAKKESKAPRVDEATLQVEPDAKLAALAKKLAEKSVKLGRPYAVMLLSTEDRARMVQAASGVAGVTVVAEGEGHWRRVAFKPAKLTAMPKKAVMPDYDDEEDE